MADNHVDFALAISITLPKDQKKLKAIKTVNLESMSFQCITAVSNLPFCQSFDPFTLDNFCNILIIKLAGFSTFHRADLSICQREKIRLVGNRLKSRPLTLRISCSHCSWPMMKKIKLADEAKPNYEKQIQAFKDQVAELQNLLKLVDQRKDDTVKASRDE